MDGINISQPIVNNAADSEYNLLPNIDAKYGPYSSTTEALMALAPNARAIGLTVGILLLIIKLLRTQMIYKKLKRLLLI